MPSCVKVAIERRPSAAARVRSPRSEWRNLKLVLYACTRGTTPAPGPARRARARPPDPPGGPPDSSFKIVLRELARTRRTPRTPPRRRARDGRDGAARVACTRARARGVSRGASAWWAPRRTGPLAKQVRRREAKRGGPLRVRQWMGERQVGHGGAAARVRLRGGRGARRMGGGAARARGSHRPRLGHARRRHVQAAQRRQPAVGSSSGRGRPQRRSNLRECGAGYARLGSGGARGAGEKAGAAAYPSVRLEVTRNRDRR